MKSLLLGWLGDFLVGNSIRVILHGNESHLFDACSGVPQGSVIGPTLFLVFINYICHNINAKFVLFADDLKLYLASKKSVSFNAMQQDIDLLYKRSRSWGLDFSVITCVHLHFSKLFHNSHCAARPRKMNL